MTLAPAVPDRSAHAVRDQTSSGDPRLKLAKTTFIALTSMTAATGLLCQPVVGSANFATSSPVFLITEQPVPAAADVWTSLVADMSAAHVRGDQDELLWVKEHSGLTWDQLGRVFGVSRRAVHLWANGGRMNEANAESLRRFAAAVASHLGSSPEETRAALLAHESGVESVIDSFRGAQVRRPGAAVGASFAPEEKVENIRGAEAARA